MKDKIVSFLITFIVFIIVFVFGDMFLWGGAEGRLVPGAISTKTWIEVYDDLYRYALISLLITAGIFYIKSRKK